MKDHISTHKAPEASSHSHDLLFNPSATSSVADGAASCVRRGAARAFGHRRCRLMRLLRETDRGIQVVQVFGGSKGTPEALGVRRVLGTGTAP